jgi:hypothetical protein
MIAHEAEYIEHQHYLHEVRMYVNRIHPEVATMRDVEDLRRLILQMVDIMESLHERMMEIHDG